MYKRRFEITEAVRGEYHHNGEVIRYDFEPGPAPELPAHLFDRLAKRGYIVPAKPKPRKRG